MNKVEQPSKQQVRDWLVQGHLNPAPPPSMAQIRRELGWSMVEERLAASVVRH